MCGIIAAIAERNVVQILLEGLKRLEYRGYDSAGLAVINDNKFLLHKAKGKVKVLQEIIQKNTRKFVRFVREMNRKHHLRCCATEKA